MVYSMAWCSPIHTVLKPPASVETAFAANKQGPNGIR